MVFNKITVYFKLVKSLPVLDDNTLYTVEVTTPYISNIPSGSVATDLALYNDAKKLSAVLSGSADTAKLTLSNIKNPTSGTHNIRFSA